MKDINESTGNEGTEIYIAPNENEIVIVDKSIPEVLFDGMKKHINKIAQIDAVSGEEETYGSILSKSIRMAQNLRLKGIEPEDIISSCTYNNMHYTIPVLASFFIGAYNAPLDPASPMNEIIHCLKLTTPKLIFCEIEFEEKMEKAIIDSGIEAEIVVFEHSERNISYTDFLIPQEPEESFKLHKVEDLFSTACIHFSSGTTGYPKAVCNTHYSLLYFSLSIPKEYSMPKRIMLLTSPFWSSNMNTIITNTIWGDTRIVNKMFDVQTFVKHIEKYKINLAHVTPVSGAKLLQHPEYCKGYDTSSLWILVTGGSPTLPKQFLEYAKLFPHSILIGMYGMTEIGGSILESAIQLPEKIINSERTCVGQPIPGFRYKVVDPETNEICGPHQEGELRIKFKGVMNAYYRNPQAYADAFDSDGFLKTGDILYYDNEYNFYYVTRVKDNFKYLGWHISPLIIETELLKHDNISQAIVFGVPSESDGEYPTAAVIVKDKLKFKEEEINQYIKDKLADIYQLRGGIFMVDSFPSTSTGKIQRRKLTEMILKMKKRS